MQSHPLDATREVGMTDVGTVTMSARELDRLEVLGHVIERRWTGERFRVHEHGRIELRHQGQLVPCRIFLDPEPRVRQADIVANKRLGAVLAQIQKGQQERDRQRLAGRKLTLRQKARIRARQDDASPS